MEYLEVATSYKLNPQAWILAITVRGNGKLWIDSETYALDQGSAELLPVDKETIIVSSGTNMEKLEIYLITE